MTGSKLFSAYVCPFPQCLSPRETWRNFSNLTTAQHVGGFYWLGHSLKLDGIKIKLFACCEHWIKWLGAVHLSSGHSLISVTDRQTDSVRASNILSAFTNTGTQHLTVGFEVLTAVSTKMAVFWVVAPCSLVEVYRRFGGTYCLHHQGNE
jgi:hypothetical protein